MRTYLQDFAITILSKQKILQALIAMKAFTHSLKYRAQINFRRNPLHRHFFFCIHIEYLLIARDCLTQHMNTKIRG